MGKKAAGRTPRKMKPVILVLCEGETEKCYVECLKQKYRLPIRVVSKVVGQKIDHRLVERHKKELQIRRSKQIDCFLVYDADVPEITGKTAACGATAVFSRPCLEVWFLAHTEKVPATDFSSDECLRRLTKTKDWKEYRKGVLSESEKNFLWEKRLFDNRLQHFQRLRQVFAQGIKREVGIFGRTSQLQPCTVIV